MVLEKETSWVCRATLDFNYGLGWVGVGLGLGLGWGRVGVGLDCIGVELPISESSELDFELKFQTSAMVGWVGWGGWGGDTILIIMPLLRPNPFGFFPQGRVWQNLRELCHTQLVKRISWSRMWNPESKIQNLEAQI